MTKPNQPTSPETLDTEQLDAAVGGIIAIAPAAVQPPENKVVTVAAGEITGSPTLNVGLPTRR